MRRRRFLAALGVGLAGCTGPNPATPTRSPSGPPTDPPTNAPAPDDRPTATPRDPEPLAVSGSWPQFGADAGHSGISSNAGVPDDAEPYWHLRRIRSGPAVLADGRLFHCAKLGADTGGRPTITRTPPASATPGLTAHEIYGQPSLVARDASEGRIEWSVPLRGPGVQWPAVADGQVVVGVDGQLAAFHAADGRTLWDRDLGDRNVAEPTVAGDAVVVPINGVVDGRSGEMLEEPGVRVHDLADGALRWSVGPPKRANRVAVAGDTAVVVSYGWDETGVVFALSLADGAESWRVELAGAHFQTPVVADGAVYVSSSERYVRALSLADGNERWRREFERRPSSVAADAGTAYVSAGETLAALDATDGSVDWTVEPDDSANFSVAPTVGGDTVYAGATGVDARLHALDGSDGTERWSYRFPDTVVDGDVVTGGLEARPTVGDGAIYASAVDGLYAFGPRN